MAYITANQIINIAFEVEVGGQNTALNNPVATIFLDGVEDTTATPVITSPTPGIYWVGFTVPTTWNTNSTAYLRLAGTVTGFDPVDKYKLVGTVAGAGTLPSSPTPLERWTGKFTNDAKIANRLNGRALIPGFDKNSKFEYSGAIVDLDLLAQLGDQVEGRIEAAFSMLGYKTPLRLTSQATVRTLGELAEKTLVCEILRVAPDFRYNGTLDTTEAEAQEDMLAEYCVALSEFIADFQRNDWSLEGETLNPKSKGNRAGSRPSIYQGPGRDVFS